MKGVGKNGGGCVVHTYHNGVVAGLGRCAERQEREQYDKYKSVHLNDDFLDEKKTRRRSDSLSSDEFFAVRGKSHSSSFVLPWVFTKCKVTKKREQHKEGTSFFFVLPSESNFGEATVTTKKMKSGRLGLFFVL